MQELEHTTAGRLMLQSERPAVHQGSVLESAVDASSAAADHLTSTTATASLESTAGTWRRDLSTLVIPVRPSARLQPLPACRPVEHRSAVTPAAPQTQSAQCLVHCTLASDVIFYFYRISRQQRSQ